MATSTKLGITVHTLSLTETGLQKRVTSEHIASSVNANLVVVRRLVSQLEKADLVHSMHGANRNTLLEEPEEISLYEIYTAVKLERKIFNVHQNPDPNRSVGTNIQSVLEAKSTKMQQKMEEGLRNIALADVIHEIEVERDK